MNTYLIRRYLQRPTLSFQALASMPVKENVKDLIILHTNMREKLVGSGRSELMVAQRCKDLKDQSLLALNSVVVFLHLNSLPMDVGVEVP